MLSFRLGVHVVRMRFLCMGCISCNEFCNINYVQLLIYIKFFCQNKWSTNIKESSLII